MLAAVILLGTSLQFQAHGAVGPEAAPAAAVPAGTPGPGIPAAVPGADAQTSTNADASTNLIPVSFQGAPIDMVIQWLASTTGKSVIKHKEVQCQLTIVSSKKLTMREALNLVYRALAAEGFSAIETSNSILIVPEGKEPKMNPELLDPAQTEIPQGRQRLMKLFPLAHAQASDIREKVRPALSDKGTIDVEERANQLMVSDYNDNMRVVAELIKALDVVSESDMTVKVYSLKHSDAEELGNMISLILNAQTSSGGGGSRPSPAASSPRPPGGGPSSPGGSSGPDMSSPPGAAGAGAQNQPPQIRVWPDKTSNRLIVSAPKSKLPEFERLLEILDTDKPRDVSVRVITLKNVSAIDLQREIAPVYQRLGSRSPKDFVDVTADDQSNSLIILSSEANFNAIKNFISTLDTEEAIDRVTRTFTLKNADAQDIAKQLQDLNSDQSNGPYRVYVYGGTQGRNKKLTVVADRRRNAVIVQAPPGQMEGVEKMIKDLDEPVTDESLAPKIYHLKYVSAVDIEDVLNELFLKKQQQRSYYDLIYEEIYGSSGSSSTADRDVGRLYGKVRITSEPYSNSLIITANSKENLAAVENVIEQLDRPSEAGESTMRIGLKFAKAPIVANAINVLFAKNGSPQLRQINQQGQPGGQAFQQQQQQQQPNASQTGFELEQEAKQDGYYPWLGGQPDIDRGDGRNTTRTVSDLVGRVRAVADERSNALLVSANVQFFPQVLRLIQEMDAETDQVVIEARLVEIASDFLDKLGVRWSPDGSKVFTPDDYDNSILAHATTRYVQGFGGNTSVNTPSSSAVAQALTSLRSGVLDSTISMDFLIQFLQKTTDATVLSAPQINIRDNEMGRLFVGQQVPSLTAQNNPALGGTSQSFVYKYVGVILEVTPHINSAGDVDLRIHAESSTVVPGVTIFNAAVIDTRTFRTDLTAKNGQTLVLGGIIQRQVSDTLRKTPILGDIPGLGWMFKKKDKTSHEVELMVFLKPKVIHTPGDANSVLDDVDKNAPLLKKWREQNLPPQSGDKPKDTSK